MLSVTIISCFLLFSFNHYGFTHCAIIHYYYHHYSSSSSLLRLIATKRIFLLSLSTNFWNNQISKIFISTNLHSRLYYELYCSQIAIFRRKFNSMVITTIINNNCLRIVLSFFYLLSNSINFSFFIFVFFVQPDSDVV